MGIASLSWTFGSSRDHRIPPRTLVELPVEVKVTVSPSGMKIMLYTSYLSWGKGLGRQQARSMELCKAVPYTVLFTRRGRAPCSSEGHQTLHIELWFSQRFLSFIKNKAVDSSLEHPALINSSQIRTLNLHIYGDSIQSRILFIWSSKSAKDTSLPRDSLHFIFSSGQ